MGLFWLLHKTSRRKPETFSITSFDEGAFANSIFEATTYRALGRDSPNILM